MTEEQLKLLKKVSSATYGHELTVAMISCKLEKEFDAKFTSERLLRHELGTRGVGTRGHLSDGIFKLGDKNIAIEIELTTKGSRRLRSIFNCYNKNFSCDEVWYYCQSGEVKNKIEKFAKDAPHVKVYALDDILTNEEIGKLKI